MQGTLTDWQGKLRVADVVGDTLRILVRRPVLGLLAPMGSLALFGWLAYELDVVSLLRPFVGSWGWVDVWTLAVQLTLAVPLLALSWALLSDAALESTEPVRVLRRAQLAKATVVATALGLMALVAVFSIGIFAILLLPLVGIAVPVCVCERIGPFGALRRAVSLTDGNRLRLLGAWVLLQLLGLLGLLLIGVAIYVIALASHGQSFVHVALPIALVYESLSLAMTVSVTTTLCVAAYGRLRQARIELDVEGWVEVFR